MPASIACTTTGEIASAARVTRLSPNTTCRTPASTVIKHVTVQPNWVIRPATTTVNPAAGPLTCRGEPPIAPATTPPAMRGRLGRQTNLPHPRSPAGGVHADQHPRRVLEPATAAISMGGRDEHAVPQRVARLLAPPAAAENRVHRAHRGSSPRRPAMVSTTGDRDRPRTDQRDLASPCPTGSGPRSPGLSPIALPRR